MNFIMKPIFTILLVGTCILSGAASSSERSLSTQSKRPDVLSSIDACKQAGVYPRFQAQQITFIQKVLSLLEVQEKAINLAQLFHAFEVQLHIMQEKGDQLLAEISNKNFRSKEGHLFGYISHKTPEGIAFILSYHKLFNTIDLSPEQMVIAQEILDNYQNTDNDEIKRTLSFFVSKLDYQKKDKYKCIHIANPFIDYINYIDTWKKDSHLKGLIAHAHTPLKYLIYLKASMDSWIAHIAKQRRNGTYTDRIEQVDVVLRNRLKYVCNIYQKHKTYLDALKNELQQTHTQLNPKQASYDTDFIAKIREKEEECRRIIQQEVQQAEKRKKQKKAQRKKALRLQAEQCAQAAQEAREQSASSSSAVSDSAQRIDLQDRILSENDIMVRIWDHKHKKKITLFKVYDPQQRYLNPNYTQHVNTWLEDPEKALQQQGYQNPKNTKYKYRENASFIHGFSSCVDQYLSLCSTQGEICNKKYQNRKDVLITMPACIESNGANQYGLFVYIIDSQNIQWYHRNFVPRTGQQLMANYMQQGYYDVEFPELK